MAQKEQTWQQWVREIERATKENSNHPSRLRKGCLAALTSTDFCALNAFVPCLRLYIYTGNERALEAARLVLSEMQGSTRWIARELIPFVREWEDRERLWPLLSTDDVRLAAVGRSYGTELVEEYGEQ